MDYSLYFESVPEGKKPENKYQYNGINTINGWLFFMLFQDEMTDDFNTPLPQTTYLQS